VQSSDLYQLLVPCFCYIFIGVQYVRAFVSAVAKQTKLLVLNKERLFTSRFTNKKAYSSGTYPQLNAAFAVQGLSMSAHWREAWARERSNTLSGKL